MIERPGTKRMPPRSATARRLPTLLVGLLLLVGSQVAHAQAHLGIRAGLNFANEFFDPEFFTNTRQGIIVGGVIQFVVSEPFSLALQPQYVQKGAVVDGALGSRTTVKLDYVEIPAVLTASYEVRPLMVYAFAGPNVGILVSAVSETEENGTVTVKDAEEKTEDLDIAVDFGAGVGYELSEKLTLTGDIRYSYGISNITVAQTSAGHPLASTNSSRDLKIVAGILFRVP
jgi:hypothetical protein